MFDIGFWELAIIAVVALLVLGPERLPVFAREAGKWMGVIKRYIQTAKIELERELKLDEAKEFQDEMQDLDRLMDVAPDRHEQKHNLENK